MVHKPLASGVTRRAFGEKLKINKQDIGTGLIVS
jgi:hypothetical protein